MSEHPFISICIPAYKRIDFLKKLLDSIVLQQYRHFEVVITDDSPDEAVKRLADEYSGRLPLRYFRNPKQLGTPENWNEGVRKARGEWIKIMHDDDWFADGTSLQEYAKAIEEQPDASFFFSAYRDVFLDEGGEREMRPPAARFKALLRDKTVLFGKNIIGPPSVVLYRRKPGLEFDPAVKWVVDIDFYIRYIGDGAPSYIDRVLINVGLGKDQVTRDCFRQREVEIPENFLLLQKVGDHHLRNILVYDAWWRLMRNLEIRSKEDIRGSGYTGAVPKPVLSMIRWQRLLPFRFWRIGPLSKAGMFLNYLFNLNTIGA